MYLSTLGTLCIEIKLFLNQIFTKHFNCVFFFCRFVRPFRLHQAPKYLETALSTNAKRIWISRSRKSGKKFRHRHGRCINKRKKETQNTCTYLLRKKKASEQLREQRRRKKNRVPNLRIDCLFYNKQYSMVWSAINISNFLFVCRSQENNNIIHICYKFVLLKQ